MFVSMIGVVRLQKLFTPIVQALITIGRFLWICIADFLGIIQSLFLKQDIVPVRWMPAKGIGRKHYFFILIPRCQCHCYFLLHNLQHQMFFFSQWLNMKTIVSLFVIFVVHQNSMRIWIYPIILKCG